MKSPLVSLIIPMHNAEAFIAECLDSAIGQTYKNLEIIVVDDDSTDKSAEVVSAYTEKQSNVVYVKTKNGNASRTRRDGLKKARGELMCFLDADDVLDENYVEHLYRAMNTTHTSIAACNIEVFSEDFKPGGNGLNRAKIYTIDGDAHSFASHYHITSTNKLTLQTLPGKLLKKDLFKGIDYTVLKANIFEDNFIMVQILRKVKKIGVIDETLYWYRQTAGSISGSTIFKTVEYEGRKLNSIEFFKSVVMEYCKKMLQGPSVDAEIDRLCATEFFNYARMVPDLMVRKEYLEEKIRLEEERMKDKDAQMTAILESKSYKLGHAIVRPVSKRINFFRGRK